MKLTNLLLSLARRSVTRDIAKRTNKCDVILAKRKKLIDDYQITNNELTTLKAIADSIDNPKPL